MQSLEPRLALAADGPSLVANIAPGPLDSSPQSVTQAGSLAFFAAAHASLGTELWKTDGTTAGTVVVKDINPFGGSSPADIVAVGNKVYFSADDGSAAGQRGLWVSDGTAAGTTLLAGPNSPLPIANPSQLTVVGTTVFFTAGFGGLSLYQLDASAAVATPAFVKFFANAGPFGLKAYQGKVYFSADDGRGQGNELWVSSGTGDGTQVAADINKAGSSFPVELTVQGSNLYFAADDGIRGGEVWRFSGTTAERMTDINPFGPSSSPFGLTAAGGKLYFSAFDGNEREAYSFDDSTKVLAKLNANPGDFSSSDPFGFTAFNGFVYFSGVHNTLGRELFRTNGVTVDVVDVTPGAAPSNPYALTVVNGQLVFAATSAANDTELYRLNANATSATVLKNIRSGLSSFPSSSSAMTTVGGIAYFDADDGIHGRELWKTDGTEAGTVLVRDANDGVDGLTFASSEGVNFRGQLFFTGTPKDNNIAELLSTDGTAAGTKTWSLGAAVGVTNRLISQLTVSPSGDALYFVVDDTVGFLTTSSLWRLRSNDADKPENLHDFNIASPHDLKFYRGRLYFGADDGNLAFKGDELWVTDGTKDGTRPFGAGFKFTGNRPTELTEVNGILYYAANDAGPGGKGVEIWKTDGNDDLRGTGVVTDINTRGDANPTNLVSFNNSLYFTAHGADATSDFGFELYSFNGTDAKLVKDIEPGAGNSSSPAELTVFKNWLYFRATTTVNGVELWRTDGTSTSLVRDINPKSQGADSSFPNGLTVAGTGPSQKLYFGADDGTNGSELWFTDGSTTDIVANINDGGSSFPFSITAAAGRLFFTADGGKTGFELYQVDPVTNALSRVADILFGQDSSFPSGLSPQKSGLPRYVAVDGTLYFSAADGVSGRELWKLTLDTVSPVPGSPAIPAAGVYAAGGVLTFSVPFSEAVNVAGVPVVPLTIGGAPRQASYVGGSGTSSLTFRYTVVAGDNAPAGIVVAGAIGLNGGTIRDAAGNDSVLALPAVNGGGVVIDTLAPTVLSATLQAGLFGVGRTIDLTVPFSEAVNVAGVPVVPLTIGGAARQAVYVGGSGTSSLTFRYTVVAGDNAPAGIVVAGAIGLNGGTIRDAAGNDSVLALPAVNGGAAKIDTPPVILSVVGPNPGRYAAKNMLSVAVTFSEAVQFAKKGPPSINLVIGKTLRKLSYVSGSGTNTLVFAYKVTTADRSGNSPVRVGSAISTVKNVNIVDANGNKAAALSFQVDASQVFVGKK